MPFWYWIVLAILKVIGPLVFEKLLEWIMGIINGTREKDELVPELVHVKPIYGDVLKKVLAKESTREYRLGKIKAALERAKSKANV